MKIVYTPFFLCVYIAPSVCPDAHVDFALNSINLYALKISQSCVRGKNSILISSWRTSAEVVIKCAQLTSREIRERPFSSVSFSISLLSGSKL